MVCFGIDGKRRTREVTEGWRRKVPVRQRRSYLPSHSRDRRLDVASSCPSSLLNTFSSARLDLSRVFPFLSHENYGEETWQWPRERNIISVFAFLRIIEIKLNTSNVCGWRHSSYFMYNNLVRRVNFSERKKCQIELFIISAIIKLRIWSRVSFRLDCLVGLSRHRRSFTSTFRAVNFGEP